MFDGCAFHRGAANTSEQHRRSVFMCYHNAWMAQCDTKPPPPTPSAVSVGRLLLLLVGRNEKRPSSRLDLTRGSAAAAGRTHPGRPHHDTPRLMKMRETATPDQLMLLGGLSYAQPSEAGRSYGGKTASL